MLGIAGLAAGTATGLALYDASLAPGARDGGLPGAVVLGLVPDGMFLGTAGALLIGLWFLARWGRQPLPVDGLDVVLGALLSVSALPLSAWALAAAVVGLGTGAQTGYALGGDAGLALALLADLTLFRRLRRAWPSFAYALAASACVIAPILWGVVQVEAALAAP